MSVEIDAPNDRQAVETALKLKELLASPMLGLALANENISIDPGTAPVVHHPERA